MRNTIVKTWVLGAAVSVLAACAHQSNVSNAPVSEAAAKTAQIAPLSPQLFEAHADGRIYLFDDHKTYRDFVKSGDTPFTLTRIGAGPNGETIRFGLTSAEKKLTQGIPSVDLFDGKTAVTNSFYGETYTEGRLYVFDSFDEMNKFRKTGEATFRYTDIGAGPAGETVVYVLPKAKSKEKPEAMMSEFKRHYAM